MFPEAPDGNILAPCAASIIRFRRLFARGDESAQALD